MLGPGIVLAIAAGTAGFYAGMILMALIVAARAGQTNPEGPDDEEWFREEQGRLKGEDLL